MKKRYRVILALAAILVAAGLWTWRFITMNAHYHEISNEDGAEDVVYEIGDTIEYGPAFSLRVDDFEIVENRDLKADPELISKLTEGDKVGCVYITVYKNDDSDTPLSVTDFTIHGTDFRGSTYWDLLFDMNPGLPKNVSRVLMEKGESHSFVLPFPLERALLTSRFDRVDKLPLYLIISRHEDIRLQ